VVLPLLAEAKEEQGRGLVLLEHNLQKKKKRRVPRRRADLEFVVTYVAPKLRTPFALCWLASAYNQHDSV
jgi:hypothetical protein